MFFLGVVDIKIAGSELFSTMYMAPYSISNHFSLPLSDVNLPNFIRKKCNNKQRPKKEEMRD
jgi:hypothetical protein